MKREDILHLEKLMNFLSTHFLKKNRWGDVTKTEWSYICAELNELIANYHTEKEIKKEPYLLGTNYLYEHLVINKLKKFYQNENATLSKPNLAKLSLIVRALGYSNYIDFINSNTELFNFSDLKIEINNVNMNTALLDSLIGCWYSYNRNYSENPQQAKEDRIWRSAMEIYKSETTGEYFIERSGGDHHKYFGKLTAYSDYIFIIMNSNTFIRQRHFISRIKDIKEKLKNPDYKLHELHFISTCISFNYEPIALFEIFRKTDRKNFISDSISFPINSDEIPEYIVKQLEDTDSNRINYR
ncbi:MULTISPECIES: hypothetical protein [Elizabethkingia]|uniref:Uncharacterized protein n=4 Tax=Elizabethkingia anophelis TaxID=1117645 RepID=A0A494J6F1_9FLAO|nr:MULTISPECIES: hypothetical protein [Elizabethkingia]AQW89546.1 hypothetical protein BBD28_02225 [Elizabethkingia anophelis]AQX50989.1 hypothetical protein AYC66_10025 [Elizabethkingia anophelis]ATC37895.1 hypothetical protein BAZ09_017335 [Elizabethkingia anophelis R26]ATC41574.1 hypothetical protein EAAG1_017550 [Elizabethkingia anophelis Ag1]ATC45252.1 hypothetical protein CMV41_17550 [Elizabethkingia anophelis]